MKLGEFSFIYDYLTQTPFADSSVILGIGDDAALLNFPPHEQVVVATDTLVAGTHFFSAWTPAEIAYRAVAVNVSDFAAMAVLPKYVLMALTIPSLESPWASSFCQGLFEALREFELQLVGGDTTRGPALTITLELLGSVRENQTLTRRGAKVGDLIYVTGELGAAAGAIQLIKASGDVRLAEHPLLLTALLRPQPRLSQALAIRPYANSAIDISDGLAADLSHILMASQVGAYLEVGCLPLAKALPSNLAEEEKWQLALSGGDDYELCFTVPKRYQCQVEEVASALPGGITLIGEITATPGLICQKPDGQTLNLPRQGFSHF